MENKFSGLPDLATTQPDRLIKYRISEDKFSAEVLLPGFSYTDFDQKIGGKLYFWSIFKLTESVRWQAIKHGLAYYKEMKKKPNFAMFIACQIFKLSEEVNNIKYYSHFGCNIPMKCSVFVSDVGKTSFCITVQMCDTKTGVELLTNVTKFVVVDKSTRKPTPFGDKYFSGTEEHFKLAPRITIAKRTQLTNTFENAFSLTVKALHSDTDLNDHVNQASYVKWASDVASVAAVEKHLKNFTRHIELYPIKYIETHHLGEALVGEEMVVMVWEDENNEKKLHTAIQRNKSVIFTMDLEFREGKLNLWSLAKLFEAIRYTVLHKGFGHFDRLKDVNHSVFMASTSYSVTNKGNAANSKALWGFKFPMHVRTYINYAGTSSFSFKIIVSSARTGNLLFTGYMTFVYVDLNTRKPALFPDWYMKLKGSQIFDAPQPRLVTPSIPPEAFAIKTKSFYQDIDFNGHVNQSVYVRWCMDAGTEAAFNGHYRGISQNIGAYPLEKLDLKYLKEGRHHETFIIFTWQDQKSPLVLHFVVQKDGQPSVVARLILKSVSVSKSSL